MATVEVRCTVCGRIDVCNGAASLEGGWPKCCGYTMRLESTDQFIDAERDLAERIQFARRVIDHLAP